ncbi:hypothetical protein BKA66DRAFT_182949 [Pyrenochaeta sp. MPI-SDFR-AT-0127]|nr:hypothetical protein BKA66DRAFT_182949 [Pyrenochaeta sp. MPI-SDFR-AT-0127]
MTERRPSGHGLDDEAVKEGHDFIHRAEQEAREHDAGVKRGLPDSAVEAEHEFVDMVEGNDQQPLNTVGSNVKQTLEKLVPSKH